MIVDVGSWLSRVRELGRWTNASQCRAIAEKGMDVALIRQHHDYTDCTSPVITNVVTIRILIRNQTHVYIPMHVQVADLFCFRVRVL